MVAKNLLEDIILRCGIPILLSSDNRLVFISQVVQLLVRAMGTNWKLHRTSRLQSSGQAECMNKTLKETLTKLTIERG